VEQGLIRSNHVEEKDSIVGFTARAKAAEVAIRSLLTTRLEGSYEVQVDAMRYLRTSRSKSDLFPYLALTAPATEGVQEQAECVDGEEALSVTVPPVPNPVGLLHDVFLDKNTKHSAVNSADRGSLRPFVLDHRLRLVGCAWIVVLGDAEAPAN
jgi:hypothetical protein